MQKLFLKHNSPFTFAPMLIFTQQTAPRLQHMATWLGTYLFGTPIQVVTDIQVIAAGEMVLNYSTQPLSSHSFHLQPHQLLFEDSIKQQQIEIKRSGETPYFFETGGDFPFDVLAATFYLLQRYEEYLPHPKDGFGRYAHTSSLAFQNDFLHLPLVDIWMLQLKEALRLNFPTLLFAERSFQFLPTYDVDIAYSYRGKGLLRNIWGLYRSLATGQMEDLLYRADFVFKEAKDPFDVFEELDELHQQHQLHPIYFLLLAQKQQGIDKNIAPGKKVYRKLIQKLAAQYKTGIHLSGAAAVSIQKMKAEKATLEKITGKQTVANRMHYLLFHLPETYRQLLQLGITQDYTMGYGSINGFRASTCTPYLWYDIATETSTALQIVPFCYMDAVSIFDEDASPVAALTEMQQLLQVVQQVNGCFVSIFHNHFIGNQSTGRQWMELYKHFLEIVKS